VPRISVLGKSNQDNMGMDKQWDKDAPVRRVIQICRGVRKG